MPKFGTHFNYLGDPLLLFKYREKRKGVVATAWLLGHEVAPRKHCVSAELRAVLALLHQLLPYRPLLYVMRKVGTTDLYIWFQNMFMRNTRVRPIMVRSRDHRRCFFAISHPHRH